MAAQVEDLLHGLLPEQRPSAAISGAETHDKLKQHHQQTQHHIVAENSQKHPNHTAADADQHRKLFSMEHGIAGSLKTAGKSRADQCQQKLQQQRMGSKGGGQQKAAEHTADQTQRPQELGVAAARQIDLFDSGHLAPDLTAEPRIVITGAVHRLTGAEQVAEAAVFKLAAFVAHVHSLVQLHMTVAVHLNSKITQLRPGHHQQAEVHTLAGEPHLQIACADTVRSGGPLLPVQSPGAHGQQEVEQCQRRKGQHHHIHHTHHTNGHCQLGEHLIRHRQLHG